VAAGSDLIQRREFLKLWGLSATLFVPNRIRTWLPPDEDIEPLGLGRVTIKAIGLYQDPDFASPRIKYIHRDKLVDIITELDSPHGPQRNPR